MKSIIIMFFFFFYTHISELLVILAITRAFGTRIAIPNDLAIITHTAIFFLTASCSFLSNAVKKDAYTNGYYHIAEHRIALKSGMSINQTMKTLIHERAHSILHTKDGKHYTRNEAEVQAESTAFVVAEVLGLDTSDYSFGYIAGWSNGKDLKELQQSLSIIEKTSREILTWITDNCSLSIPNMKLTV